MGFLYPVFLTSKNVDFVQTQVLSKLLLEGNTHMHIPLFLYINLTC